VAYVQTSKVDAKFLRVKLGALNLFSDRYSKDEQLLIRSLYVRNEKYEHVGLTKVEIHILFYECNS
jgi:hypothetical protein